jgi:hypothetical protein
MNGVLEQHTEIGGHTIVTSIVEGLYSNSDSTFSTEIITRDILHLVRASWNLKANAARVVGFVVR